MHRVQTGFARQGLVQALAGWLLVFSIAAAGLYWLCIYAPDEPPPGSDTTSTRLVITLNPEGPNDCPDGYIAGDIIHGGRDYTCWRRDALDSTQDGGR